MREFHAQGRTIEEIAESLKNAPLPAKTVAAIKSAYSLGYVRLLICLFWCFLPFGVRIVSSRFNFSGAI